MAAAEKSTLRTFNSYLFGKHRIAPWTGASKITRQKRFQFRKHLRARYIFYRRFSYYKRAFDADRYILYTRGYIQKPRVEFRTVSDDGAIELTQGWLYDIIIVRVFGGGGGDRIAVPRDDDNL